jgi:NADPH-dependent curcumin reductase CurA
LQYARAGPFSCDIDIRNRAPAVVSTFIGRLDGKNFGKLLLRVS